MSNQLNDYLSTLQPIRDPILLKMKDYAVQNNIPIMEDVSMAVLLSLMKLKKPQTVLEIGTAIGYSAIRMAKACKECKIVSCDLDEKRLAIAKAFLHESGFSDRITLIYGDALDDLAEIEHNAPYDMVFIDAAKGQYEKYFKAFSPMVAKHGMVVSDNVFFRGMVPGIVQPTKRYRTVINRLREYNEYLVREEGFETTFYPIGDGLAVSIKTD